MLKRGTGKPERGRHPLLHSMEWRYTVRATSRQRAAHCGWVLAHFSNIEPGAGRRSPQRAWIWSRSPGTMTFLSDASNQHEIIKKGFATEKLTVSNTGKKWAKEVKKTGAILTSSDFWLGSQLRDHRPAVLPVPLQRGTQELPTRRKEERQLHDPRCPTPWEINQSFIHSDPAVKYTQAEKQGSVPFVIAQTQRKTL